jgi:hypothetical protein
MGFYFIFKWMNDCNVPIFRSSWEVALRVVLQASFPLKQRDEMAYKFTTLLNQGTKVECDRRYTAHVAERRAGLTSLLQSGPCDTDSLYGPG